jgi:hypothetical protein
MRVGWPELRPTAHPVGVGSQRGVTPSLTAGGLTLRQAHRPAIPVERSASRQGSEFGEAKEEPTEGRRAETARFPLDVRPLLGAVRSGIPHPVTFSRSAARFWLSGTFTTGAPFSNHIAGDGNRHMPLPPKCQLRGSHESARHFALNAIEAGKPGFGIKRQRGYRPPLSPPLAVIGGKIPGANLAVPNQT